MTRKLTLVLATVLAILFVCSPRELFAQSSKQSESIIPDKLALHSVRANTVIYRERTALRITDTGTSDLDDASRFALVRAISFQDGTIEVTLSGDTVPDAPPQLRGFVGIAFRVSADESQFECFYIRPKNGRSDDQLQRNHSAQYISIPGFPWQKLRSQTPGKYEAYVDLVPGEWLSSESKRRVRPPSFTSTGPNSRRSL
jgi:hypothetical protein